MFGTQALKLHTNFTHQDQAIQATRLVLRLARTQVIMAACNAVKSFKKEFKAAYNSKTVAIASHLQRDAPPQRSKSYLGLLCAHKSLVELGFITQHMLDQRGCHKHLVQGVGDAIPAWKQPPLYTGEGARTRWERAAPHQQQGVWLSSM